MALQPIFLVPTVHLFFFVILNLPSPPCKQVFTCDQTRIKLICNDVIFEISLHLLLQIFLQTCANCVLTSTLESELFKPAFPSIFHIWNHIANHCFVCRLTLFVTYQTLYLSQGLLIPDNNLECHSVLSMDTALTHYLPQLLTTTSNSIVFSNTLYTY